MQIDASEHLDFGKSNLRSTTLVGVMLSVRLGRKIRVLSVY